MCQLTGADAIRILNRSTIVQKTGREGRGKGYTCLESFDAVNLPSPNEEIRHLTNLAEEWLSPANWKRIGPA